MNFKNCFRILFINNPIQIFMRFKIDFTIIAQNYSSKNSSTLSKMFQFKQNTKGKYQLIIGVVVQIIGLYHWVVFLVLFSPYGWFSPNLPVQPLPISPLPISPLPTFFMGSTLPLFSLSSFSLRSRYLGSRPQNYLCLSFSSLSFLSLYFCCSLVFILKVLYHIQTTIIYSNFIQLGNEQSQFFNSHQMKLRLRFRCTDICNFHFSLSLFLRFHVRKNKTVSPFQVVLNFPIYHFYNVWADTEWYGLALIYFWEKFNQFVRFKNLRKFTINQTQRGLNLEEKAILTKVQVKYENSFIQSYVNRYVILEYIIIDKLSQKCPCPPINSQNFASMIISSITMGKSTRHMKQHSQSSYVQGEKQNKKSQSHRGRGMRGRPKKIMPIISHQPSESELYLAMKNQIYFSDESPHQLQPEVTLEKEVNFNSQCFLPQHPSVSNFLDSVQFVQEPSEPKQQPKKKVKRQYTKTKRIKRRKNLLKKDLTCFIVDLFMKSTKQLCLEEILREVIRFSSEGVHAKQNFCAKNNHLIDSDVLNMNCELAFKNKVKRRVYEILLILQSVNIIQKLKNTHNRIRKWVWVYKQLNPHKQSIIMNARIENRRKRAMNNLQGTIRQLELKIKSQYKIRNKSIASLLLKQKGKMFAYIRNNTQVMQFKIKDGKFYRSSNQPELKEQSKVN